ncbi:murein biosynthesis integral membrane protein MurJ [Acidisphaera sp. L21]|uniref:murein biosynthesis integral membrane protein MurJ n=1 Tax=Acidisphaera sp. L21 TaxID=1641851 RepID=UPI00131A63D2|nr:murein biosynthesis integral membrane protein MurJ [Acidisphaera sp. L21]
MLRGILTVGGWTMGSRLLGFARDMLIAALAGTGGVADAFFVANKLPNMFRRLFGEGAFNAAFVPEFTGLLATEGHEAAKSFAQQAISVLAFWLLGLTVLGEIFMPGIMHVLAPGFVDEPGKFQLAVDLARITFPYLILICLAALLSGVLNGLDHFAAAAAAPMLYNISSIAAMLLLTRYVPTVGHALAWGVSIAGVAQLALLVWATRQAGMPMAIPRPRLTPAMRILLRRMLPGLVGASAMQLNQVVDVIVGSLLPPGAISLLYYADRVNQLPLGTIGAAVGTALLPLLSRQVRGPDPQAAITTLNRALEFALVLTVPAALALIVSGYPILAVLFQRGAFDLHSALLSSQSLAAYALGLPFFVLVKVLAPAFFARSDTTTPVRIGMITLVLNFALNLALMIPLQHIGPALATSLAAIFNVGMLALMLHRKGFLVADTRLRRRLPRIGLAAVAMAATLWLVQTHLFNPVDLAGGMRWAALAGLVGAGSAVYGVVGLVLGAFEGRELLGRLRRRPRAA